MVADCEDAAIAVEDDGSQWMRVDDVCKGWTAAETEQCVGAM